LTAHTFDEQSNRQITVLFVEDDSAVRLALVMGLLHRNFKVLEAGDGDEALAICRSYEAPIDIVVADVVMPRMWGNEFVSKLEQTRPNMPVLYISGHSEELLLSRKVLGGGEAFLPKPFQAKVLAEKIISLLARVRAPAVPQSGDASPATHTSR